MRPSSRCAGHRRELARRVCVLIPNRSREAVENALSDIRIARARPASRTREDTARCPRDPHGAAQGVREMNEQLQRPGPGSIEDVRAEAAAAKARLAELAAEVGFTLEEQKIFVIEFEAAISKAEPSLLDDEKFGKPVHLWRLQTALSDCKLSPVASADVQDVAAKINRAVGRWYVRDQLSSVARARAEDKRAREIRLHAVKLARLLSKQDGLLAASLEGCFDRLPPPRDDDNKRALRKRLTSPFELRPSLIQLAQGAKLYYTRGPRAGLPTAPKEKVRSPMQMFIRDLAPCFTALFDKRASVTRVSACNKGGAFPDFVRAVARRWQLEPPSVEAIAQALRSD
jgi:hypothetical protein